MRIHCAGSQRDHDAAGATSPADADDVSDVADSTASNAAAADWDLLIKALVSDEPVRVQRRGICAPPESVGPASDENICMTKMVCRTMVFEWSL